MSYLIIFAVYLVTFVPLQVIFTPDTLSVEWWAIWAVSFLLALTVTFAVMPAWYRRRNEKRRILNWSTWKEVIAA